MKIQVSKVVLGLLAFSSAIVGADEKLTGHQVPQAVHDAFKKAYPNAKELKYEQEVVEGKKAYEIEFNHQGKEIEAVYGADGTLIETEEEIKISELPGSVSGAVKTAHPKGTIKEAEKILEPDGTVSGYEVEVKEGKKEFELELDASGTILKTEAEDKD